MKGSPPAAAWRAGWLAGCLTLACAFAGWPGAGLTTAQAAAPPAAGQLLARQILDQAPPQNSTVSATLLVRHPDGTRVTVPLTCFVQLTNSGWDTLYEAVLTNRTEWLRVRHTPGAANTCFLAAAPSVPVAAAGLMTPFAGSDFCLADLGLDFLSWPEQHQLRLEIHRSRGCTVLESVNPAPGASGYSRVVSWIDNETLGIVEAVAYDAQGRKLKDFYPKDFQKVAGHWQVQTLELDNLRTGSRSRLTFHFKK